ncbi:MAG: hypothetical protein HC880_14065 [Bacteroidia bacterium]|nr:hypothetical protein [Bacteroidia bacterium]
MWSNFFKRTNGKQAEKTPPLMADLHHNVLREGDTVQALRYGLGKCRVIIIDGIYHYESLESGEKVSWIKMIDAATDLQKVKKI